jgi:hypothetical protein
LVGHPYDSDSSNIPVDPSAYLGHQAEVASINAFGYDRRRDGGKDNRGSEPEQSYRAVELHPVPVAGSYPIAYGRPAAREDIAWGVRAEATGIETSVGDDSSTSPTWSMYDVEPDVEVVDLVSSSEDGDSEESDQSIPEKITNRAGDNDEETTIWVIPQQFAAVLYSANQLDFLRTA